MDRDLRFASASLAAQQSTIENPSRMAVLRIDDVRFGFPRHPDFLGPVSLTVELGQRWAVVGPNGAGKSTLLRLMAGLLVPRLGRVVIDGTDVRGFSPPRRARLVAYLPQHTPRDLASSVRDVVLLGRFPHRSFGLFESAADFQMAEQAMRLTETHRFAERPLTTLSGGEAQRVHLAACIAQSPRVLLLDEPTASLDLRHQIAIRRILFELARQERAAVVLVTHDLQFAAGFATHVLVLHDGRVVTQGAPGDALSPRVLEPVFGVKLLALASSRRPDQPYLVPANEEDLEAGTPR